MKIGIITFHRSHNYGALFQAYALKEYLILKGAQVEIIDYWPDYHSELYKLLPNFSTKTFKGKIKVILNLLLGYKRIVKRSAGYMRFIKNYLKLNTIPEYTTSQELENLDKYDVIFYGSDQIWRKFDFPNFKGFNKVYWGIYPIHAEKKISYAASMGIVSLDEKDKALIAGWLKNFNAVSVRENQLKDALETIQELPVSLVLDPVFLLEKDYWKKICKSLPKKIIKPYILLYQITYSPEARRAANLIRAYSGYEIIEIRGRVESQLLGRSFYQTAEPTEFLTLVDSAEMIVSTSFHGVAFSILFEKEFYSLGMGNNAGRVTSLLENLSIENRYITNVKEIDLQQRINYDMVRHKLNQLKSGSADFISNALKL